MLFIFSGHTRCMGEQFKCPLIWSLAFLPGGGLYIALVGQRLDPPFWGGVNEPAVFGRGVYF